MRITVSMQDNLISDLMEVTQAKNKTQAVNIAIKEWMRYKKLQKIKSFRGKFKIDDDLSTLDALEIEALKELNEQGSR